MNYKYIAAGLIGCFTILGWNIFLIQRDAKMYDAYYGSKAMENLQKPPSSEIR